jgi:hypothetical protein
MQVRESSHCVAPASRRLSGKPALSLSKGRPASPCRWLSLILLVPFLLQLSSAKAKPAPALNSGYLPALAAADHFLQAWQSGDAENGMVLLTRHGKDLATTDVIQQFFSNEGTSAYEIGRGKLAKRGRYEFPVVLVTVNSKNAHGRRRFSSIVVVNTGDNDWAVDKLP